MDVLRFQEEGGSGALTLDQRFRFQCLFLPGFFKRFPLVPCQPKLGKQEVKECYHVSKKLFCFFIHRHLLLS